MNAFDHMVDRVINAPLVYVSREQLEEFDRQYVLYALKDMRYGRAFCEHFNIPRQGHGVIWHMKSNEMAKQWIIDNYIL